MRLSLLLIVATALASCQPTSDPAQTTKTPVTPSPGDWTMSMRLDSVDLIQRIIISENDLILFHNAEEIIETEMLLQGDTVYIEMPVYHTHFIGQLTDSVTITGNWYNQHRSPDYSIPFEMVKNATISRPNWSDAREDRFAVRFSPDTEDEYPAVGVIQQSGERLKGTFLTETGDYRFLEGSISSDQANLQCFDGSHVFHFSMQMTADSLIGGTFRSGTHWSENFVAAKNSSYTLTNPDSLTYQVTDGPITFSAMDMSGEIKTFNTADYEGKVTIIQLFGTWCPNCLDESKYYAELSESINDERLQIIPVAFERSEDFDTNALQLKQYQEELALPFQPYLGGKASKSKANEVFPMLNHVMSFPTSIFIDQNGEVQRIHTGFYGPGSLPEYEAFKSSTEALVLELLGQEEV
ncbi:MAG: TlpA disulfide reductase family protein [Flavobacteriales bacterium]|nr:TlpA disulfide reductase family protein [Flavobacteriales bacterium]